MKRGYFAKQRFSHEQWNVVFPIFFDMITPGFIDSIASKKDCTGSATSSTAKLVKNFSYSKWKPNDPQWGREPTLAMFSRENKTEDEAAEALRRMTLAPNA